MVKGYQQGAGKRVHHQEWFARKDLKLELHIWDKHAQDCTGSCPREDVNTLC